MAQTSLTGSVPDLESTLYVDILRYQRKAADMVSTLAPAPTPQDVRDVGMPLYEVGVVNAIIRRPTVLGGLPSIPYIEYQVALTRRSDNKTATVGKRYSELYYFNHELHRRDIIRKLDAPSFPEKKVFCDDWWLMQTLDPDGKFVRERREEIHYYLKKLFIANPNITDDLFVQEFFDLATFDHRAAVEPYLEGIPTSASTASGASFPSAAAASDSHASSASLPLPTSSYTNTNTNMRTPTVYDSMYGPAAYSVGSGSSVGATSYGQVHMHVGHGSNGTGMASSSGHVGNGQHSNLVDV